MTFLSLVPFAFHAIIMVIDEVIHEKRGLLKWERRGHPLDTLTVIACFSFIQFVSYGPTSEMIYLALAIFSTLFITKDEWVHHKECDAFEQWLHSLLFILHPIVLFIAYKFWQTNKFKWFLDGLPIVTTILFLYQVLRWNIFWKAK